MSYIHCNPITTDRLRVHETNRIVPPCVRSSECRHGMRTVRVFGRSRTAASPTIIRCRKFRTAPNRSRARQKTVTADLPVAYVPASMSAITLVSENLHSPPRRRTFAPLTGCRAGTLKRKRNRTVCATAASDPQREKQSHSAVAADLLSAKVPNLRILPISDGKARRKMSSGRFFL